MKALILAAGYATRLYPLTKDKAKPLLPVGSHPVIGHILKKIETLSDLTEILVVINHKFYNQFEAWVKETTLPVPVTLVDDGSVSDNDKLGAIGDIQFAIKQRGVREDLLVVGGDNLFDFSLEPFLDFAKTKIPLCAMMLYDVKDFILARQYGIITLNGDGKVTGFEEKPEKPSSTLAGMCVYFFPNQALSFLSEYERLPNSKDAPGHYMKWLHETKGLYGFAAQGRWYDIGDIASYQKACETFEKGGLS